MIAGPVFVTPHACEQFRTRIAGGRGLSYEQALDAIIRELREYGREPKPLHNGRGYFVRTRGGRYSFRAVILPGEGDAPAVVTILRSGR